MLRNGWWAWISDSYPAGANQDITITKNEWSDLKKELRSDSERILCDRAWSNEVLEQFEDRKLLLSGHVKPHNKPLEPWQVAENEILGHYRGKFLMKILQRNKHFNLFNF